MNLAQTNQQSSSLRSDPVLSRFYLSVEDEWDLECLVKRYACDLSMLREWQALKDCAGVYVQVVRRRDLANKAIVFEYDNSAKPLNLFTQQDVTVFVDLLPSMIRAIQHCHDVGWVHGDIKPSNMLYVPDTGSIRLIDFGGCQRIGAKREQFSSWQMTPYFASEEQIKGIGKVNEMDDWQALLKLIKQVIESQPEFALLNKISFVQKALMKYLQKFD